VRPFLQHMVRYCAANQQALGKIRLTNGTTARFAQCNNYIRTLVQDFVTGPSDDAPKSLEHFPTHQSPCTLRATFRRQARPTQNH
jgi:hypothetical protein